jgi:hypothetical protein
VAITAAAAPTPIAAAAAKRSAVRRVTRQRLAAHA